MASILVTGAAGFIGAALANRLLDEGHAVVGWDCLSDYYDVSLKRARLDRLAARPGFTFENVDVADRAAVGPAWTRAAAASGGPFAAVVHLAAQAGVRYSLSHPEVYLDTNIAGFGTMLELCRHAAVPHLVYASSSSVYGLSKKTPFAEADVVDQPVSLYAATKKANEGMAHAYSHLFGLPTTGLRFFTVYGPWGRPDMAMFKFVAAMEAGRPIDLYNRGDMERDFTYIDDCVTMIIRVIARPPAPDPAWDAADPVPATSSAPAAVYNVGNQDPVRLSRLVAALEAASGLTAVKNLLPMQPGDVTATHADMGRFTAAFGEPPSTPIEEGVARFVAWYREYHGGP